MALGQAMGTGSLSGPGNPFSGNLPSALSVEPFKGEIKIQPAGMIMNPDTVAAGASHVLNQFKVDFKGLSLENQGIVNIGNLQAMTTPVKQGGAGKPAPVISH